MLGIDRFSAGPLSFSNESYSLCESKAKARSGWARDFAWKINDLTLVENACIQWKQRRGQSDRSHSSREGKTLLDQFLLARPVIQFARAETGVSRSPSAAGSSVYRPETLDITLSCLGDKKKSDTIRLRGSGDGMRILLQVLVSLVFLCLAAVMAAAGDDRSVDSAGSREEARRHWAFQPIGDPPPPDVRDTLWSHTAADRFILARLEAAALSPATDADRYTWLRRVRLDLTGIPPTPEEIEAFVHDSSPQADARVVDRLLASPAFGERWARHWLDLVGYADQIGTSNDVFAEHAWRYRDYVIAAFNADKPFDEFIREQIAGD